MRAFVGNGDYTVTVYTTSEDAAVGDTLVCSDCGSWRCCEPGHVARYSAICRCGYECHGGFHADVTKVVVETREQIIARNISNTIDD